MMYCVISFWISRVGHLTALVNLNNSADIENNYILLIASITFALFIYMNKCFIMPGNIEYSILELYFILIIYCKLFFDCYACIYMYPC